MEVVNLIESILIFFAGIPVGVIGIIKAKRMIKLRNATIALSIINLFAGIIEILILLFIFYAVVFRGVSH